MHYPGDMGPRPGLRAKIMRQDWSAAFPGRGPAPPARSTAISERVNAGTLAIAGVTYHLADGKAALCAHLGDIGETG